MGAKREGGVAVFMLELFSCGAFGKEWGSRNRSETYACRHETRFADRGRPIGQTVGP